MYMLKSEVMVNGARIKTDDWRIVKIVFRRNLADSGMKRGMWADKVRRYIERLHF